MFVTKVCVLERSGKQIEATPYPLGAGEHFVKWSFNNERRSAHQVESRRTQLEEELQQLGEQIEVKLRLKSRQGKTFKSFEEL